MLALNRWVFALKTLSCMAVQGVVHRVFGGVF